MAITIGEMEVKRKELNLPDGVWLCERSSYCYHCQKPINKGELYINPPFANGRVHYPDCIEPHFLNVIKRCEESIKGWKELIALSKEAKP